MRWKDVDDMNHTDGKRDLSQLPMPPVELRRSVGVEDVAFFENPHRHNVFGEDVAPHLYRSVFDFGSGCGRIARQMILQQDNVPSRYLGIDLYQPSINWCNENLVPFAPQFEFRHLNVFNAGLNPEGEERLSLGLDEQFSLINAHSVFTHIVEEHIEFYFSQCANALTEGGVLRATWFLFDKTVFPMMQEFQNCLYINSNDPTNATIYDRSFVEALYNRHGLTLYRIHKPYVRGHQWLLYAIKGKESPALFPEDDGPIGLARPPVTQ